MFGSRVPGRTFRRSARPETTTTCRGSARPRAAAECIATQARFSDRLSRESRQTDYLHVRRTRDDRPVQTLRGPSRAARSQKPAARAARGAKAARPVHRNRWVWQQFRPRCSCQRRLTITRAARTPRLRRVGHPVRQSRSAQAHPRAALKSRNLPVLFGPPIALEHAKVARLGSAVC